MPSTRSAVVLILNIAFIYGIGTILTGSNEVAFKGRSFTLTCKVTSGELDAVVFLNIDKIIAGVSYTNGECKHRESGTICLSRTCSCNGTSSYNWTVQNVPDSWHNTTLSCDSVYGGALSNTYILYVSVAVTEAQILPNVSVINQIAGNLIRFTCYSHPASRPKAIIRWYSDDKNGIRNEITEGITHQTYQNSNGENIVFVSNSTLFYSPNKYQNGYTVYCTATTTYASSVTSTKILLNVLFKPDSPLQITTIPIGPMFQMNSTVHLTCQLKGGNPIANLTWSCETLDTSNITVDYSTNNSAVLVLTLFITPLDMDTEECACEGSHFVDDFKASQNVAIRLFKSTTHSDSSTSGNVNVETTAKNIYGTDDKLAAIIGGVIGAVVAIVIVVGLVVFIRGKKKPDSTKDFEEAGYSTCNYITPTPTDDDINNTEVKDVVIKDRNHTYENITEHSDEGKYDKLRESKMSDLDRTSIRVISSSDKENHGQEKTCQNTTRSSYVEPVSKKNILNKITNTTNI